MNRPISRRQFVRAVGAAAVAHALAPNASAQAHAKRPNVLFIAIDDLNDWCGCLGGHPDAHTPNIDRLAARGVLFTHAYCAAPACNPSRTALLTGLRPATSGVYLNSQPWRPVLPDAVTLPQHFMANGYRVIGGGKIFHGRYKDPASWHEYLDRPLDPLPPNRPLSGIGGASSHFDWGPVDVDDRDMADWKVADWAIEKLQQESEQPFFLAAGFYRPHLPWYVPRKYFDRFPPDKITLPNVKEDDLDDVPPIGRKMAKPDGDHKRVTDTDNWRKAVAAYLASGTFADACVGRVVRALENSHHADNTVIVLWADHGWHLGEKLHWRKFALWEEATRNPLLFVVPGTTQPGGRCERPVSLLDIYPTLVQACGLPSKPGLEGHSLIPLLKDPAAPWDRPALTTHGRNNHALRSERWRYVRYEDATEELYDHTNDPMEWTNLADRLDLQDVKAGLAKWLPKTNAENAPGESKRKRR